MEELLEKIEKRRTFAIISHPDAGKTTLTEKLLLYGGAIHLAGSVKARKSNKHAVSDWMEIEKQRGISVTSSVLQFDYDGYRVNILDTPGHHVIYNYKCNCFAVWLFNAVDKSAYFGSNINSCACRNVKWNI